MAADVKGEIKRYLRARLFNHKCYKENEPSPIEEAKKDIKELLERSIKEGESNSLLLLGPRGAGKSLAVDKAFSSLSEYDGNFIKIYLNGFVHTDDHSAILEIACHLDPTFDKSLPFSASLSYVLQVLKSGTKQNQCVVIIMDEFDLFARHKNQILLYNLFDLCQSPVNPIVVIGLTCRLDVIEILEKRVKSRFSHRQVLLFPNSNFDDYLRTFTSLLLLPYDKDWIDISYCENWNKQINELIKQQRTIDLLQELFYHSTDYQCMKSILTYAVSKIGFDEHYYITFDLLQKSSNACSFWHKSKSQLMADLCIMDLYLLVACKKLYDNGQYESLNFELIFYEYHKFVSKHSHSFQLLSKSVVFKALRRLVLLEFLCSLSPKRHMMIEYQPLHLMLSGDEIVECVRRYKNCPTELYYWVTNSSVE